MKISRKTTKCKICRQPFFKLSMKHKVCGNPSCVAEFIKSEAEKVERRVLTRKSALAKIDRKLVKERLAAIKPRSKWMKEAQAAFNAFVRERDKHLPCICCGRMSNNKDLITGSRWDAGHYRSTGSAPHLRFDERNVHRQLVLCNRYGSGRAVDYRIGLIARIGIDAVEALENDNAPRHWTKDDLREIRDRYREKLKALKKAES